MVGPEKMIKKNKRYEKKFTNYIQFKAQPKNKIKRNQQKQNKNSMSQKWNFVKKLIKSKKNLK